MKKIIALVLALAMVLMVGAAFAENAEPSEFMDPQGSFLGGAGGGPETTITATNIEDGDKVYYIQLVEWNGSSAGTGTPNSTSDAWKLTSAGESCGVSLAELLNGITAEEAATIASNLKNVAGVEMTTNGTTATKTNAAAGLYYLRAVASSDDTIYNPAFVSADYYDGNNSVDFSGVIGSSAVVKKSTVTFDKQVGHGDEHVYTFNDVKPGDYIPYKIKTQIPAYGSAYDSAVFTITDTFSTGLVLAIDDQHKFEVTYGNATGDQAGVTNVYTSDAANAGSSFTINFDSTHYLLSEDRGVTDVVITYWGKVTTDAPMNVNPLDNTADLEYSNKPGDTSDKHDITRHYTFSIDGNLLGQTGVITKELMKVGLDANGNVIEEGSETVHTEKIHPLAGASFTLAPYSTEAGFGTNTQGTITSSAEEGKVGTLTWHGLDAGTYSLVENSAPAGFVKDSRTFYIKIDPDYTGDILNSYKILWGTDPDDLTEVTSFTLSHIQSEKDYEVKVNASQPEDDHAKVENTQGTELPSTGGIGTTIFYILGGLLVIGAAVILVARRKAQD